MLRKTIVLGILVLLNVTVFYGAYLKMQMRGAAPIAMPASPVPEFSWTDLENTKHSIKELSGKVVVLHFWATWCAPCRSEFPRLLKSAATVGNNVVFLTLSVDDSTEIVKTFIHNAEEKAGVKTSANVMHAVDLEKKIAFDLFQTSAFPETIIIDTHQNMRRKYIGGVAWNNPEVIKEIESYQQ